MGAKTFDHLVENDGRDFTALAFDSVEKKIYFADNVMSNDGTSEATIGVLSLEDAGRMYVIVC